MNINQYLQFIRPANIVTSLGDILAGFAIAYICAHFFYNLAPPNLFLLPLLLLSTAFLYAGGIILNDLFDADIDAVERPERLIPSGKITKKKALFLGIGALLAGIILALSVNHVSGLMAMAIALLAILYDGYTKHFLILGPVNMALCRAINLLLGMSVVIPVLVGYWYLACVPLFYIIAVTLISKGEVHGGQDHLLLLKAAFLFYVLAIVAIFALHPMPPFHPLSAILYLLLLCVLIFRPLIKAMKTKAPDAIRQSVKKGILGLIVLDAAIIAGYVGFWYGLLMLVLLIVSLKLGRKFAVT